MSDPRAPAVLVYEPGICRGIPASEYHAWDIASRSMLTKLADTRHYTPADVRHEMLTAKPDTDALALGSALHVALLEPARYAKAVAIGPVNPKTGRTYERDTKAWEEAEHAGDTAVLLTTDQATKVPLMAAALRAHPQARAIFERATERELSVVVNLDLDELAAEHGVGDYWRLRSDDDAQLLAKARLDMLCPDVALVADLKTSVAATEWELRKSVTDYGYYQQSALYPHMARAAGFGDVRHFALVVVRSEEPYRAAVLRVTEESQRIGWQELLPAMALAARCYRLDDWPGWPEGVIDVDVAEWKLREVRCMH